MHMPIYNIKRCPLILYMFKIDVAFSLKWFTASTQV